MQCPTVNFSQILSQILVICPTAKFCAKFLPKFLPIFTKSQITNHKICDRSADRIFCDKFLFLWIFTIFTCHTPGKEVHERNRRYLVKTRYCVGIFSIMWWWCLNRLSLVFWQMGRWKDAIINEKWSILCKRWDLAVGHDKNT